MMKCVNIADEIRLWCARRGRVYDGCTRLCVHSAVYKSSR